MQYVYLIEVQGYRKIGIAGDVKARLATLQTGNPHRLRVESCYRFENADPVEKALHQKFSNQREIGEWFDLSKSDVEDFHKVCILLGGNITVVTQVSTQDEIDDAEDMDATMAEGAKWDYAKMFSDGWRMEASHNGRGNYGFWQWRKSDDGKRKSIYGGKVSDLPYPIESMKEHYK